MPSLVLRAATLMAVVSAVLSAATQCGGKAFNQRRHMVSTKITSAADCAALIDLKKAAPGCLASVAPKDFCGWANLPTSKLQLINCDLKTGRVDWIGLKTCGLKTLPASIGNLTALKTLILDFNSLTASQCKPCNVCLGGQVPKSACTTVSDTRCQCGATSKFSAKLRQCVCKHGFAKIGGQCKLCPKGFEVDDAVGDCQSCPFGKTTVVAGAPCTACVSNDATCTCASGHYDPAQTGLVICFRDGFEQRKATFKRRSQSQTNRCVSCRDTPCVQCDDARHPTIAAGWELAWHSGPASMSDNGTKLLFACPGGHTACVGGTSRSACGKNQTDALCSACDNNFYKADDKCAECGTVTGKDLLLLAFYSACLLAALVLPRYLAVVRSADIGFYRSCKIVVSYFQVVSVLGLVLDMPLSVLIPAYAQLAKLSRILYGNLRSLLSQFQCLGLDHLSSWALEVIIVPICLVFGLWLTYRVSCWREPQRKAQHLKTLKQRQSLGLFLFYRTICSEIFSLMQCRKLGEHDSCLRADSDRAPHAARGR